VVVVVGGAVEVVVAGIAGVAGADGLVFVD